MRRKNKYIYKCPCCNLNAQNIPSVIFNEDETIDIFITCKRCNKLYMLKSKYKVFKVIIDIKNL